MGKTRIIAETGAGQHGVATATVAARLGLECVVYMGEEDIARQSPNVYRMKLLGAEVRSVTSGSRTLKDALNEAMRDWVANVDDTYYIIGTVAGPHPYPQMVRDFNSVIGREAREQVLEQEGRLPDAVVACVGGGSNAIGIFYPFLDDPEVSLYGVEAAGDGLETGRHAAPLSAGSPGVLHGNRTYLMQDEDGQIIPTHSVSAGLDYPGVGPEHAWLRDRGRATYVSATDVEALDAFERLTLIEGIIPALESSHAVAYAAKACGRSGQHRRYRCQPFRAGRQRHTDRCGLPGDIDVSSRIAGVLARLADGGRKALIPYIAAGDPNAEVTVAAMHALVAAGGDVVELGMPFSDPMADGPVIQRASERALAAGMSLAGVLEVVRSFREVDGSTPVVLMGYLNPIEAMGYAAFADRAAVSGVDGVLVVDLPPEEATELSAELERHGLDPIFLLAPNTDENRIRLICSSARGYVYYVSLKGVTGSHRLDTEEVAARGTADQILDRSSGRGRIRHRRRGVCAAGGRGSRCGGGRHRPGARVRGGGCRSRSDPRARSGVDRRDAHGNGRRRGASFEPLAPVVPEVRAATVR